MESKIIYKPKNVNKNADYLPRVKMRHFNNLQQNLAPSQLLFQIKNTTATKKRRKHNFRGNCDICSAIEYIEQSNVQSLNF